MIDPLHTLRLAAVNIDGVMLNDSFSPVIHQFVTARGGSYTAELEAGLFSQSQLTAARTFAEVIPTPLPPEELVREYLAERAAYVAEHPVHLLDGALELLAVLRGLGLRTVCYGGLEKDHFDRYLGAHAELFDGPGYVCTNDFRPGLREITTELFGLEYRQVLFIDDVARVAEQAKALRVPFVGHPSHYPHSHQRAAMERIGVRHLVRSLHEIDAALVRRLDREAAADTVWPADR
ncbi:haloacid dehalogenase-like hydrolase [Streptomyces tateyamensis]|uniref:Haloacid dehalogenase-like hydrolase n=1 Tax=Streptomyces tateyamensis TaxID=565073 RepID=A0A2V4NUD9_9ACTN|nr:HAD family phosphatase [Streptomyces tateyamensis]PYC83766.1 haloacid dehalogenase-like hydrolase [Streptomyces tateyamensis]